jgi:D-3-phosphoglycerate dehydrogenase
LTRRVLITCLQLQENIEDFHSVFADNDIEIHLPEVVQQLNESQLLDIIEPFHGVIAGDDEFTGRVLEKATNLKMIARWGIGVDGVDLAAAERLGICVTNTPNVFSDEAADVAMAYIVLLARQLHVLDRGVREGNWLKIRGISLRDKVLGVIGVGNIGRAVVRRGVAAGMKVIGYDVNPVDDVLARETGFQTVDLDDLLRESDFISLNCNLTDTNWHMLSQREFSLMKAGAYIINVARGPLIDEAALLKVLDDRKISGAALDVFETEPLTSDSPLRKFENCIFGTHNSSNTHDAVSRVNEIAVLGLIDGLNGKPVINLASSH